MKNSSWYETRTGASFLMKTNPKRDKTTLKFSAANFNCQDKFRCPKGFNPSTPHPAPPSQVSSKLFQIPCYRRLLLL